MSAPPLTPVINIVDISYPDAYFKLPPRKHIVHMASEIYKINQNSEENPPKTYMILLWQRAQK